MLIIHVQLPLKSSWLKNGTAMTEAQILQLAWNNVIWGLKVKDGPANGQRTMFKIPISPSTIVA